MRNKFTSEAHVVKLPFEIVFTVCLFLLYWTWVLKAEDRNSAHDAIKVVIQSAKTLVRQHGGASGEVVLYIDDA